VVEKVPRVAEKAGRELSEAPGRARRRSAKKKLEWQRLELPWRRNRDRNRKSSHRREKRTARKVRPRGGELYY
jgi:hypothetical protein